MNKSPNKPKTTRNALVKFLKRDRQVNKSFAAATKQVKEATALINRLLKELDRQAIKKRSKKL